MGAVNRLWSTLFTLVHKNQVRYVLTHIFVTSHQLHNYYNFLKQIEFVIRWL